MGSSNHRSEMDECRRNPQIVALDAIVNINFLFTLAVFFGVVMNATYGSNTLVKDVSCVAGKKIEEDLVFFQVFSFISILFSTVVAKGVKQAIKFANSTAYINKSVLRGGMLVSVVGSVCGFGFQMMALVSVIQIKLGTLACWSSATIIVVVPLVILVPTAVLIFFSVVLDAFTLY